MLSTAIILGVIAKIRKKMADMSPLIKSLYSKEKLSVHLIHTRVLVQGSIVGVLTGMLGYQFYK